MAESVEKQGMDLADLYFAAAANQQPTSLVTKLAAQFLSEACPVVEGQWYFKEELPLDGYHFVRCRFENCTITISRGSFRLTNCLFTGCTFIWTENAMQVVKTLGLIAGASIPAHLQPLIYQDKTVTI